MRKVAYIIFGLVMSIPLAINLWACVHASRIAAGVSVIAMFGCVAIMPACRRRENLWIFLMTIYSLFPVNVKVVVYCVQCQFRVDIHRPAMYLILCVEVFLVFLSVEEVAAGFIARILWKNKPVSGWMK